MTTAAVAVVGVFAQADVGDDEDVGQSSLDGPHGRLDRRLGIVGRRADVVFVIGKTEQQHAADSLASRRLDFTNCLVDRQVEHPGH